MKINSRVVIQIDHNEIFDPRSLNISFFASLLYLKKKKKKWKIKNCTRCLNLRLHLWFVNDPFPVHRFDAIRLETANRIKVHRYSVGIAVFTTALLSFQPSAGGGWPNCQGGEKRTKAESRSFLFPLPLFSSFFFLPFLLFFPTQEVSSESFIHR